jgi:Glyoxalase/Bleomycin resistance protein/Dioxygenase superfamily
MPGSPSIDLFGDDPVAARQTYGRLLGVPDRDRFVVDNATVRIHPGSAADNRVIFGVENYASAARLLGRRGLALTESGPGRAVADDAPVGIGAIVERTPVENCDITTIDHLVFDAPSRDGAVALFGATLGFDFRLEQSVFDDAIQLFFRTPAVVIEVLVRRDGPPRTTLWGIAWRSSDIVATHHRLGAEGITVTPIRDGRKPGTRVFTVKEPALVVPTLVIA